MATERKSEDLYVDLPDGIDKSELMVLVKRAAERAGLYVSHIGSYSRKKYPGSVHWHFKRDPQERGLIDMTYWDVKALLWLMIRHREPVWVHAIVPRFRRALARELKAWAG